MPCLFCSHTATAYNTMVDVALWMEEFGGLNDTAHFLGTFWRVRVVGSPLKIEPDPDVLSTRPTPLNRPRTTC